MQQRRRKRLQAAGVGKRTGSRQIEPVTLAAGFVRDQSRVPWQGDLEKIESSVRGLEYGDVEVWDAYGNLLR